MNLLLSPTYMKGVVELLDLSDNTLLASFFFLFTGYGHQCIVCVSIIGILKGLHSKV